ncbi:ribonuclease Z [Paenibacillus sp. J2TS4]|uniref:ribonuclease Z n=1 Tax=Paenibacillus sp. J2TS4 TaxID=2807194 RepID=UPI001AFFA0DF|nr:ribonuclease Z [Paenibacillus sp. J2TS4]GIP32638.1 ribonuclease Z [Paenibacillus sp. J2TS4]
MRVVFLGTGAGMPSRRRNVSSVALDLTEENEGIWLFDCGEGTQHQLLKSPLKTGKINRLFVTHLHGDHIYGIPGLLTSRGYVGGTTPLVVYGPKGIKPFITSVLDISDARLAYDCEIIEIEEGMLFSEGDYTVSVKKLEHRIDSYGFRIEEKDRIGSLDADKLRQLGVPPGPLYGRLKLGHPVELPDGTVLHGRDFIGPGCQGRNLAILGDTRYCRAAIELAEGVDLLVHEATFSGELADLAYQYYHATSRQAAQIAKEAGVRTLVLTHISQRYQDDAEQLQTEAREIFRRTYLAEDLWSIEIPWSAKAETEE